MGDFIARLQEKDRDYENLRGKMRDMENKHAKELEKLQNVIAKNKREDGKVASDLVEGKSQQFDKFWKQNEKYVDLNRKYEEQKRKCEELECKCQNNEKFQKMKTDLNSKTSSSSPFMPLCCFL